MLSPKWISAGREPVVSAVSIPCVQYPNLRKVLADIFSGNRAVADTDRRKTLGLIETEFNSLDGLAHKE